MVRGAESCAVAATSRSTRPSTWAEGCGCGRAVGESKAAGQRGAHHEGIQYFPFNGSGVQTLPVQQGSGSLLLEGWLQCFKPGQQVLPGVVRCCQARAQLLVIPAAPVPLGLLPNPTAAGYAVYAVNLIAACGEAIKRAQSLHGLDGVGGIQVSGWSILPLLTQTHPDLSQNWGVMEMLDANPSPGHQLEAKLAYGLPTFDDRLTRTPGVGVVLSSESRAGVTHWVFTWVGALGDCVVDALDAMVGMCVWTF